MNAPQVFISYAHKDEDWKFSVRFARSASPVPLVLDNVVEWTSAEHPSPLPASNARLLVTTRARRLGGTAFEHFALEFLAEEDARRLLQEIAGKAIVDADGFEELLRYYNPPCRLPVADGLHPSSSSSSASATLAWGTERF